MFQDVITVEWVCENQFGDEFVRLQEFETLEDAEEFQAKMEEGNETFLFINGELTI